MVNEQWIGKSTCNFCGHQFTVHGSHVRAKQPYFYLCAACFYNEPNKLPHWYCYKPDPTIKPPDPLEALQRLRELLNGNGG